MKTQTTAVHLLLKLLSPNTSDSEAIACLPGAQDQHAWRGLVSEADRLDARPLLYLRLKSLGADRFCPEENCKALQQAYLSVAGRNTLNLHVSGQVLRALRDAGLNVITLKGMYLLENVYPDIGARSMNDLDILLRKEDLGKGLGVMRSLGYEAVTYFDVNDPNLDIKHIPPLTKLGRPAVELHWTLLEEDEPFQIDVKAIWQRAQPARVADVNVLSLSLEDLVAHLCLHFAYQHYLRLGLRGLYDIALILWEKGDTLDWDLLAGIARRWGAGRTIALTLALVSDVMEVELPAMAGSAFAEWPVPAEVLADAQAQLLGRQPHEDYLTPDLLGLTQVKGVIGKVRLGLRRLFLPRRILSRIYGVPPNSIRILGCYFSRLRDLWLHYGQTLRKIGNNDISLAPALEEAKVSESLHSWMSS